MELGPGSAVPRALPSERMLGGGSLKNPRSPVEVLSESGVGTILAIAGILGATLVVYSLFGLGFALVSTYVDTDLPTGHHSFSHVVTLYVGNRATFELPFLSQSYSVGVKLVNATRTECTLLTVRGYLPWNETRVYLGHILAGGSETAQASITPGAENFTIVVEGYYIFWFFPVQVATRAYKCTYVSPFHYMIEG